MGLVILLLSLLAAVALALDEQQVALDADDGIDYDMGRQITTARKNVRLTRGDLLIVADQIIYYNRTGIVEATGHVRYKTGTTEYQTDALTYNMLDNTGQSAEFRAVIAGEPRDFIVKGKAAALSRTTATLSQVAITRCPKARPDYLFSAAQVKFQGRRVQLKHVLIKVKGIPVFYIPALIFYTDFELPLLEPGYDEDYGYKLKYQFHLADTEKREWNMKGELSGKGDANVGVELVNQWRYGKNVTDFRYYYWHNSWKLTNSYSYDRGFLTYTLDGFKEFNDKEEAQIGLSVKRKYWRTPVGQLQAGISVRRMLAQDGSGDVYGGTYSGVRLDYKPITNVELSLLEIKSYSSNDYRDLMDDFGIGTNLLYAVNIPLNSKYTFGLSGSYNFPDSRWYHEVYSITANCCCFQPTVSFDRADHSWDWGIKIRF
jgi:hypothetical protein